MKRIGGLKGAADRRVSKIDIVGGGTAGWMTAARLAGLIGEATGRVVLIGSEEIETASVDQSTLPTMKCGLPCL